MCYSHKQYREYLQKAVPVFGEVLLSHDGQSIADLELNLVRNADHELNDLSLDGHSILRRNFVFILVFLWT